MAWETKLHSKHWIAHHAKVMFSLDFTSIYEFYLLSFYPGWSFKLLVIPNLANEDYKL